MAQVIQKSIGLTSTLWRKLAKLAKDDNRKLTGYIRDVLQKHVDGLTG